MKKVELVKDWKLCKKWLSIRLSILGTSSMSLWLLLPQLRDYISADLLAGIAVGLFILIALSRLINQGANERNDTNNSGGA